MTVCGLLAKKKVAKRPISFLLKHPSQKVKGKGNFCILGCFFSFSVRYVIVILSWFVDAEDVKMALDGRLLDEEKVECIPERLPNAIVDDSVDVHLVRRYFTSDAWMVVQDVVQKKKERTIWTCRYCYKDLGEQQSIACESCLEWFHFNCVGLAKQPKARNWFCRQCFAACKQ